MGVAAIFGPGTVITKATQQILKIMIKGFKKLDKKKTYNIVIKNLNYPYKIPVAWREAIGELNS